MRIFILALLTVLCVACQQKPAPADRLQLLFHHPAQAWEETIPLGNGRIGMMPDGGIHQENIVLNDITLWSGGPQQADNPEAYKSVGQIQSLLLEGKNDEAEMLVNKNFVCIGRGSGFGNGANDPYGCFQLLGNLTVDFKFPSGLQPDQYERSLDLETATAKTVFSLDGVQYTRTYFTSFGDDVGVIKYSTDGDLLPELKISMNRPEHATIHTEGDELILTGQLPDGTGENGMKFESRVKVKLSGGKLNIIGNELVISGAKEVLMYVATGTDFRENNYTDGNRRLLDKALATGFEEQKNKHIHSYQSLFSRVSVKIGKSNDRDTLSTPARLSGFFNDPARDPAMAVLYYQYGRYLSISSTRPGLLPPNLQGLWAHRIQTPWNGDYHLNINAQMNHWALEAGNLSELHKPFIEMIKTLAESGKETARAYYNAPGWVVYMLTNIWGYSSPGEQASWGASTASGWLCNHLWEHYQFTQDTAYLKEIYPVLQEAARFYQHTMIREPEHGWLVTAPSVSPENAFIMANGKRANVVMGPTIDNQIVRELYNNVLEAARITGIKDSFQDTLRQHINQLPPPVVVGEDGRVMEWLKPYEEAEPRHRHISHLYGLYPAPFISPVTTPEWAAAAKKTLEMRGDEGTGWSKAWKILFWARLQDGNHALELFRQLLKPVADTSINMSGGGGTYPNLFCAHPPFQIDGNFGGAAGIGEMLLQSHAGFIHLLPALPDSWGEGEVKGMKARGNYTVDFTWKDGKVTDYKITGKAGQKVKLLVNGKPEEKQL